MLGCPRTLSAPRGETFTLEENCELRGTGNVHGQISEHIFAPNGDYYVYYPSNSFRNARSFENWGMSLGFSPVLVDGLYGLMMSLRE